MKRESAGIDDPTKRARPGAPRSKVLCELRLLPQTSIDSGYLTRHQQVLEAAISAAIEETLCSQPDDPISFCAAQLAGLVALQSDRGDGGAAAAERYGQAPSSAHEGSSRALEKNDPAMRNLSKLVSKLLRHEAQNLGVPITDDGYVTIADVTRAINGRELRDIVGNTSELAGVLYSDTDVEGVVRDDDKQRFVVRQHATHGQQLRAAQGHTMKGVKVEQKELTLETAPLLAVHGSYWRNWDAISKDGLSRMNRHQIHLARELPGKDQVISGMRNDAELQIWVDVHRAMREGTLRTASSYHCAILLYNIHS